MHSGSTDGTIAVATDSPPPLDPGSITVEYSGTNIVIIPSRKSSGLVDITPHVFKFLYFTPKPKYLGGGACASVCRDGKVAGTETCDDGNAQNGDGCSSTCSVECGFDCGSAQPSVCLSSCGDGKQASDELCDDGNTVTGDGCSSTCSFEPGWECSTRTCGKTTCPCVHENAASDASGDCACNAGYTGPNGGTCMACEAGKYKDATGPTACAACPASSVSPAGLFFLFS